MSDIRRQPDRPFAPAWLLSPAARPLLIFVGWTAFGVAVATSYTIRADTGSAVPFGNRVSHVLPFYWIWAILTPVVIRIVGWSRERSASRAGHVATLVSAAIPVALVQLLVHLPIAITLGSQWQVPFGTHLTSAIVRHGPGNLLLFGALALLISALDYRRRMIAELASARLDALRAQLQPHFLFNALQTTVSLIRQDPTAAEAMIERLADFLRMVLRRDDRHLVPLREELDLLDHYLAVMRYRFGPRLAVTIEVEQGLEDRQVPVLLLQPLVENALHHGVAKRAGAGRIDIGVRRSPVGILVRIADDGPGPAPTATPPDRIGLGTTRARLATLFGAASRIDLSSSPGGTVVEVELPALGSEVQTSRPRTAEE